jgi:hypothetical protein
MELVDAAYNSSGSSANQFAKTQESLESKIARLENAWNQFLMGIADSGAIKTAIDLLTGLLNTIDKLTTAPDWLPFDGLATSIMKVATAFAALRGAKKIVDSLYGSYQINNAVG